MSSMLYTEGCCRGRSQKSGRCGGGVRSRRNGDKVGGDMRYEIDTYAAVYEVLEVRRGSYSPVKASKNKMRWPFRMTLYLNTVVSSIFDWRIFFWLGARRASSPWCSRDVMCGCASVGFKRWLLFLSDGQEWAVARVQKLAQDASRQALTTRRTRSTSPP
jgi:hypothetical protein